MAAWTLAALMLAAIAFTPIGRLLFAASTSLSSLLPSPVQPLAGVVLFIAAVTALCEMAVLPTVSYRTRRIAPAYGRSDDGGLRGRLAESIVLLPAVVLAGVTVHAATLVAGRGWWLLAGVLLSMAFALAVRVGPVILGRVAGVRPLARPALATQLAGLASRVGVPVAAIQEWRVDDASPTVAMVAGIGSSRRVLVAADVVRHWSDDEVAVVVAHELAHHVHRDLWRSLALDAAVLCAGLLVSDLFIARAGAWFGLQGASDPAALPVVAFATLAVWLLATPIRHAQSRRHERRADRFALASTGQADAFATVVRRASARYLADEQPSLVTRWLFHRHPSVAERLALAERFQTGASATTGHRPPTTSR